MMIPQPPGGTMETIGRMVAEPVARALGQNVVIDNRTGANGIIAAETLARATPDGYTLLYTSASLANNDFVHKKLPYNFRRDFAPVTQVTTLPGYLVLVGTKVPAQSLRELVELSRTSRTPVHFGSSGVGNSQHLLGELINARAGAKLAHVPTVSESGMPGFVYEASWHGVFAPAATPAVIIVRFQGEVARAVQAPKMRAVLEAGGHVVIASTPAEFRQFLEKYFKDTAEQFRIAKVAPQ
jgi:tripartite-type tricarboxylate transporter receptor subunit TctC